MTNYITYRNRAPSPQDSARLIKNTDFKPSFSLPQQAMRKESKYTDLSACLDHHKI